MTIKKRLIALSKRFMEEMKQKNIASFAGSSSYFLFMSLIPMLILASYFLPFTNLTRKDLVQALEDMTPRIIDPLTEQIVNEAYENSVGLASLAAILMIWTGATGMLSLIRGFNCIWNATEKRNYFRLRAIAGAYTVLLLLALLLMLMMAVFGNDMRTFMLEAHPELAPMVEFTHNFRFLFVYALVILFFALLYTFVPSIKLRFIYQLPGAIFAGLVWAIFSGFFTLYVSNIDAYSIYGSLGTIIICMFWMYVGLYLLLVGAFINMFFKPAFEAFYGHGRSLQDVQQTGADNV